MPDLVTIGRFSRLTHLSVKTLHHYHDVGLLDPAAVDPHTNYRLYDPGQATTAHLIRRLRGVDMPIDRISAVLAEPDGQIRGTMLADHLIELERERTRVDAAIRSVRSMIDRPSVKFDVRRRRFDTCRARLLTAERGPDDVGPWLADAFEALRSRTKPDAANWATFDDAFFEDGLGGVVAFVADPDGTEIWQGGDFLTVEHHGPDDEIDRAYGALGAEVARRAAGAPGAIVERYTVRSTDGVANETIVCWPTVV